MTKIFKLSATLLFGAILLGFTSCDKDKEAPVITIVGNNPLTHCVGVEYVDPGATAFDNSDGNITDKIKTDIQVDISKEGTNYVIYEVTDDAGNKSMATRVVNVIFCR